MKREYKGLTIVWVCMAFAAGVLAHDMVATHHTPSAPPLAVTYPMPEALSPDDFALLCAHAGAAQMKMSGCPGTI